MKKTYFKIIFSEIKKSFGRFVAIFAIVTLGIGFLTGLLMATPDMHASVDTFYDKYDMSDLFIKSTAGITEEDLKAVSAMEEVELVMPAYVTDALMKTNLDDVLATRIYGLPLKNLSDSAKSFVNRLELVEGRMPESKNECLVEQSGGYLSEIKLGMTLTVSTENEDYENIGDIYDTMTYEVVGIVSNPFYFSLERETANIGNGRLGAIIYVDESCYSLGVYTDLYITVSGASGLTAFSKGYETAVEEVVQKLETMGLSQSMIRYDDIVNEATKKLEEAKSEYADAKLKAQSELSDALAGINDGKAEILSGEAKITDAEKQYSDGIASLKKERLALSEQVARQQKELSDGQARIKVSKATLVSSKASLDAVKPDIDNAKALRDQGTPLPDEVLAQIAQYDAGLAAYEDGMAQIAVKEAELSAGEIALEKAVAQAEAGFKSAEADLANALIEIQNARADLEKAKTDLAEGEALYNTSKEEAEEKLAKGALEIDDAQKKIDAIEIPEWYVLDRNSNVSYVSFSENSKKVAAIATVFPIFFLLVAALIALTTMTRMVEEERTQIGTLKALGYTKGVIMYKYIAYCGTASFLGSITGLLAGFSLLPGLIWNAYAFSYHLPPFLAKFDLRFALIATSLALLSTIGATVSACYNALKEKPASLMLPRAPKAGKRIFLERIPFIWSKMKFSKKATARNLVRNKKHFFLTVFGIAGCTALVLTGFGLRDSVGSIASTQFDRIIQYDLIIEKEKDADPASLDLFLNDPSKVEAFMEISTETGYALYNGEKIGTSIYVPKEPLQFRDYIHLNERVGGKEIDFSDSAAVMTEKLADALGIGTGDSFTLENKDGKTADFVLTGITENYVGSYIYIHPKAYAESFKEVKSYDTLLVKTWITATEEQDAALTAIMAGGDVSGAEFTAQVRKTYDDLLATMDFVVIVLILAAGALAVIVLYNLTNININERRKELATLRVLGFHHKEVGSYIFRETTIMTVIGTAAGLLLGVFLHYFVITIAESTNMMFGRSISAVSFLLSAAATFVFSLIVNLIMYQKLKKIEMVDSMKAID